jgi:hypothetical protein
MSNDAIAKEKANAKKEEENFKDKTIEVKGKFKAIAKYNKTAQKWNVTITLLCKKNSKITSSETEFKDSIEKLVEEKLKQLGGWNDKKTKSVADNDFYVKSMNGEEWFKEICDLGSNVWENATLPKSYWDEDQGSKTSNIRMPALFTGVADGGIEMVSDYPQLVKLGYDIATKDEMRAGIWNGVKNITPEKIKVLANDAVKEKWKKYNSPKQYIQAYEAGKDGVTVIKMLVGGSLITGIKDVGEKFSKKTLANVGELVKDIVAKRKYIRDNIIELAESKELARLFAKKIGIKDADFEDWFKNSFKTTEKGTINFQAHHVIPVEILEKNDKFNELLFRLQGKADFDFNGIDNGIMLQAKSINLDVAGHAKHKAYTDALDVKITEICSNAKIDDLDKLDRIKDLVSSAKEKLKKDVLLGNKDVNDIVNF